MNNQPSPLLPFTFETGTRKVRFAKDMWNRRGYHRPLGQ